MDAPEFFFRDNIDVEDFIHMTSMNQYRYKINMRQFDPIAALKLPYVFEGPKLRRMNADDKVIQGFWYKLQLNGSGQPVARENATLMPIMENGNLCLYLFGGSPMTTGQFNFEMYKIHPSKNAWQKIEYERPIVQTLGSRPIYKKDPKSDQFKLYFFSG